MALPEPVARVLVDVHRDIDRFLEDPQLPGILAASPLAAKGAQLDSDKSAPEDSRVELVSLRGEADRLHFQLEEMRGETAADRIKAERAAVADAGRLARLTEEREQVQREQREKRQRTERAEASLRASQKESEALSAANAELSERAERQTASLKRKHEVERDRLEAKVGRLEKSLRLSGGAGPPLDREAQTLRHEAEALRARVAELEQEGGALRLLLEQGTSEREMAANLREHHIEYEDELRKLRVVRKDLEDLRARHLELEQESSALKAQVAARDEALQAAEAAASGARLAKRDLAAFAEVAAPFVAETRDEGGAGSKTATGEATPHELSLACSRHRRITGELKRKCEELQRSLDTATGGERQATEELGRLKGDLDAAQRASDDQAAELRRARDAEASLMARLEVLRDALRRGGPGVPGAAAGADAVDPDREVLGAQLSAALGRLSGLEEQLRLREQQLRHGASEREALRKQSAKLSDAEAKAARLERANAEIWAANQDFERRAELLKNELAIAQSELPTKEAGNTVGVRPEALGSEATWNAEAYQKATQRLVRDFREGIYGLLGWRVEMRAEGSEMLWHLTSRFREGGTLTFRLRPAESGRPAEFDFIGTPWGEELLSDRQAMAYLELRQSPPGFLAHLTAELASNQALPS